MPELSRFFGIIIYMYREIGGRHHFPHIHAAYGDSKAVFNIDTATLIEGDFPKKQKKLVEAWIELRRIELGHNWARLNSSDGMQRFIRVEPLR